MRSKLMICAALAAPLVATACAPVDHGYGEAVKYNMAVHTVNPDPVYTEEDAKPGDNGEVGAKAVQRYRQGNVKQPSVQSSRVGGGGSGGGGGGSSGGSGGGVEANPSPL